jgi:hypothetical protein
VRRNRLVYGARVTVARAPARCGPMRLARWALRVCVVCRDAWSFSSVGPCGVGLIGPWRLNKFGVVLRSGTRWRSASVGARNPCSVTVWSRLCVGVRFGVLVWYRPPGMISDRKRKLIEQYTVSTPRNSNASPTRGTPARVPDRTEANRRAATTQDRAHGARAGFSSGSCLLFVRAESRPDDNQTRQRPTRQQRTGWPWPTGRVPLPYRLRVATVLQLIPITLCTLWENALNNNKTFEQYFTQTVRPLPAL